jgi:CRP/FNR family transcriptional regulator
MLATALAPSAETVTSMVYRSPTAPKRPDLLADHLVAGAPRIINAREHIYREGDTASHVYRIESGHVCIYRMVPDGRRQVLDFAYPGDIIGLGELRSHAANAQASTKARIRCIPVSTLHEITRNDQRIGMLLYDAMSQELQAARELLFTVSQRTAAERVAAFLSALSRRNARRHEDASQIVLPMTRADIADYLGLTIETVSRTFTKFRVEGLIDLEQFILVTILNPDALAALADGTCEGPARSMSVGSVSRLGVAAAATVRRQACRRVEAV